MSALRRFLYHRETCKNFQSLLAECDCGCDDANAELTSLTSRAEQAEAQRDEYAFKATLEQKARLELLAVVQRLRDALERIRDDRNLTHLSQMEDIAAAALADTSLPEGERK